MRLRRFTLLELLILIVVIVAMVAPAHLFAGDTEYASGTTSAAVKFGPTPSAATIASIYSTTDKAGGTLKIYAWNNVAVQQPTTAPAATNIIAIDNSSSQLATSDHVMYVHSDGTLDYRTVSSATTTNVTLSSNISQAGSTSDKIYELTQQAQLDFDTSGAGVSTFKYGKFEGGDVFSAVGPIYIVQDGTSNAVVNATLE